jgi:hypothetical protein
LFSEFISLFTDFSSIRQRREVANPSPPNTPHYYKEYIDDIKRYVELILIADHSVYEKYEKNEETVHDRMQSIANIVNSVSLFPFLI